MSRDTLLLIINILIVIAFGIYSSISQGDPSKLSFSLPLISILISFVLFLHLMAEAEKRLNQSLDRRLPSIEHLENKAEVESETTKLVGRAAEFIIATGGRSSNESYLKAIEDKVNSGDVTYWRLVFDEEITHEMCQHICSILDKPNAIVGQIIDRDYGNILAVDSGYIVALPIPGHGGLMGIKVPNSASAQRIFRYVMVLNQNAHKIASVQQVKAICEKCGVIKQIAEPSERPIDQTAQHNNSFNPTPR